MPQIVDYAIGCYEDVDVHFVWNNCGIIAQFVHNGDSAIIDSEHTAG